MPASAKNPRSLSAFGDRGSSPTPADLKGALGHAASAWADLVLQVTHAYPPILEQWNFASAKFGWSLRLKRADRIVLYLIPQTDQFLVGIVLGAKAVTAAQDSDLPPAVLKAIAAAPRYAEGVGVRLPVKEHEQLAPVQRLTALKMAGR